MNRFYAMVFLNGRTGFTARSHSIYRSSILKSFSLLLLSAIGLLATSQPNIVYIISDDQTYTDFGFMGHEQVQTPHLDRLAGQSTFFPNGYVTTSVCRPSLVTLLTGLYPFQHGVHFNHPPPGFRKLTQDPEIDKKTYDALRETASSMILNTQTLPRLLSENGYRCFQTGKYWEGHWRNAGFTEGMTTAEPSTALNGNMTLANGEIIAHGNGDAGLAIGRETLQPIYDFIDDCGEDQPFMIWYAPFLPHVPHDSPQKFYDLYQNKGIPPHKLSYYACISWFDETVGDLIQAIEERGISEETLFVFVVDNGFEPKPDNPNSYTHTSKRSPFDPGLRTPILLHWKGVTTPVRYEELVSSVDLFPTILDAAGIKPTFSTPGLSLWASALGNPNIDPRRAVFGGIYPGDASTLGNPGRDIAYRWVRQDDFKLIVPSSRDPWGNYLSQISLYDLSQDPHESKNLFQLQEHQETLTRLKKLLDSWWKPE